MLWWSTTYMKSHILVLCCVDLSLCISVMVDYLYENFYFFFKDINLSSGKKWFLTYSLSPRLISLCFATSLFWFATISIIKYPHSCATFFDTVFPTEKWAKLQPTMEKGKENADFYEGVQHNQRDFDKHTNTQEVNNTTERHKFVDFCSRLNLEHDTTERAWNVWCHSRSSLSSDELHSIEPWFACVVYLTTHPDFQVCSTCLT